MKRTILFIAAALFGSMLTAQTNNNLVVFTEQGEKITVILNGVRQNPKPETNVKVTGLNNSNMKMKVIFEDKTIPDLDQTIYFMYGGEAVSNHEFSCAVIKKGTAYKARLRDAVPIASAPADPAQTTVVYTTVAAPDPVVTGTTVTTTTTTTGSTTGAGTQTGDNVSIGMNIGGLGMNMNVNVNDGTNMNTNVNTTSSSTTTYSTTTTTTTTGSGMGTGTATAVSSQPQYVHPGYNGVYGCPYPMQPKDFESAKESIRSKSFDDSRLTLAKQIIGSNCMLCSQVKEIMLLFSFEATRLDLAKYSYKKTLDQGNYYKLNDAFTFESSIDELNKHIEANK